MNNDKPKYEYLLKAWGGFWNDHNIQRHKIPEFDYKWFDTKEERDIEIKRLKEAEYEQSNYLIARGQHNDSCVVMVLREGYNTRVRTVLHRVVKIKETGEEVYSNCDMGYAYPYVAAMYHLEWKWTPGCNDEVAIEDEEDLDKIEIISEWVTGAFNNTGEYV